MHRTKVVSSVSAVIAALLAGYGVARADQAPLRLSDFAFSVVMTPQSEVPVHRVRLPEHVYGGVTDADLADLRVFNDDGRQVPHAIRTLDVPRSVQPRDQSVPFFPLRTPDARPPPMQGLTVGVDRGPESTHVELRSQFETDASPDAGGLDPVTGYIIDTRKVEGTIAALRIELEPSPTSIALPLRVDATRDLQAFRSLGMRGTLVDLEYEGAHIRRERIELPMIDEPFLRLRAQSGKPWPSSITAVHAELEHQSERAPRVRSRIEGVAREGESGVYVFDLGGFVPVDEVRVLLPHDNMLVQATLVSSRTRADAGDRVYEGPIYRIRRDGKRIQSKRIQVSRRSHRYWVLHVEDKGGGLGGAVPKLEHGRDPDQLLFVARGPPPFHLAFGHHDATPAGFSPDELLELMSDEERAVSSSSVQVGSRRERAGESALTQPRPTPPYKRYLLWATLILGAVAIIWTSIRMLKGKGASG